jgi:hypothetical protein
MSPNRVVVFADSTWINYCTLIDTIHIKITVNSAGHVTFARCSIGNTLPLIFHASNPSFAASASIDSLLSTKREKKSVG